MKITIDVFHAMRQKTGIGYYTHHLISHLVRCAPENDYYLCDALGGSLFYSFYNMVKLERDLSNADSFFRIAKVPFPFVTLARLLLFLQNKVSGKFRKIEETDIFFGTNFRGIFRDSLKNVITIHDMAHEYFPETIEGKTLNYLKSELSEVARRASCLIAVSESTKKDILRFLDVPEKKVKVIYNGIDKAFKPVTDSGALASVRKRYGLPDKFILYLGTIQPRKNVEGLIRAFSLLCKEPAFRHELVLAGEMGWKSEGVKGLIKNLSLEDRVRVPGYVEDVDVPALYSLSDVFVFPSLCEGFGFPVLEAMACGTPVVTANVSSLPEVAGDAALLVDPHSVDDIADGMRRLLSDNDLRQRCIDRGLERAKLFTWEKCARETLSVFEEVMSRP